MLGGVCLTAVILALGACEREVRIRSPTPSFPFTPADPLQNWTLIFAVINETGTTPTRGGPFKSPFKGKYKAKLEKYEK